MSCLGNGNCISLVKVTLASSYIRSSVRLEIISGFFSQTGRNAETEGDGNAGSVTHF